MPWLGSYEFLDCFCICQQRCWKHKAKWMILGITSICILNIARIALIALGAHLHWKTITSLDHHQTFNIFSYGCIFILMYLYIRIQKKYEGIEIKRKKQNNKFSQV
ncbi:MAG: exosortase/archaeosortase family protein [Segetibacter sp.]